MTLYELVQSIEKVHRVREVKYLLALSQCSGNIVKYFIPYGKALEKDLLRALARAA